ncbi:MAG TPA: serine hydrolase [Burkholderiales bacterium]|nr:serine hydrolase [Burkholderiales bacterium]
MRSGERRLHSLEKIVAIGALAAVLFVSIGFARADEGPKLRSAVALVLDAASGETLYAKNSEIILPIASITKLMTAIVVLERGLDLEQRVAVSAADLRAMRGARMPGRLRSGSVLTRDELLLLTLMASENRAAAALARTYPGGTESFVAAMNAEAGRLGLHDTRFADPTGLSPDNVSSAQDLARLVRAAHGHPLIREYSTRPSAQVRARGGSIGYSNTNRLVRSDQWDIELSKTGYIGAAGRCLVMHMRVASRDLVVILLDSWGKYTRLGDARRIRKWLEFSAAREPHG